jgi:hypothetical protein
MLKRKPSASEYFADVKREIAATQNRLAHLEEQAAELRAFLNNPYHLANSVRDPLVEAAEGLLPIIATEADKSDPLVSSEISILCGNLEHGVDTVINNNRHRVECWATVKKDCTLAKLKAFWLTVGCRFPEKEKLSLQPHGLDIYETYFRVAKKTPGWHKLKSAFSELQDFDRALKNPNLMEQEQAA